MKIKKNLNNINFFKLIFGEIYLLVSIIIIASSVSIYISAKQSNKIKETYSKATVILPPTELFFIAQIAQHSSILKDSSLLLDVAPETLRERFNLNFTSNLISLSNLQNFLDLEVISNFNQSLSQKEINIKNYFNQKNLSIIESPIDKKRKFVFILSLKHPVGFDGKNFLKSYIEHTKSKILNDYVKMRVDAVNRVISLLKNNLEITKKYNSIDEYGEDNRIEFFKLFLEQILDNKTDFRGSEDILFNYLEEKINYLATLDDLSINKKIEILEFIKKNISYFEYEPILEIYTIQYFEKNLIYRNVVMSILISFVIFFSIIFFKQIYKEVIKK